MDNCNNEMLNTNFNAVDSETGEFIGEGKVEQPKKFTLTARGYRRVYMKKDGVYEKFMKSLSSSIEISISIDFMRDIDKDGKLIHDMSYYQNVYNISRPTVSKIFTKAKKYGLIKSAGRLLYINPYVVLPYQSTDKQNYFLQRRWDLFWKESDKNNGKLSKEKALEISSELIQDIL